MNHPIKTCPACGADLSAGTAALPGVCPACGRDLKLEEIVANLPRTETKRMGPPLTLMKCFLVAFAISFTLGGVMGSFGGLLFFFIVMIFVVPHFFLGIFTAGFFSRTADAQLLWGFLLSVLFLILNLGLFVAAWDKIKFYLP